MRKSINWRSVARAFRNVLIAVGGLAIFAWLPNQAWWVMAFAVSVVALAWWLFYLLDVAVSVRRSAGTAPQWDSRAPRSRRGATVDRPEAPFLPARTRDEDLRGQVISALRSQGWSRRAAARAVFGAQGNSFDELFASAAGASFDDFLSPVVGR